jgi:hypothetical protein
MSTPDALFRLLSYPLPAEPTEADTHALLDLRDAAGLPRFACEDGLYYRTLGVADPRPLFPSTTGACLDRVCERLFNNYGRCGKTQSGTADHARGDRR